MTHFKKLIRRMFIWTWWMLIAVVLFFNLRLYAPSPLATRNDTAPPMLAAQLAANRAALESGAPLRMQQLFPEGYYFSYLFHGLTWVELAMREPSCAPQAIQEAVWCLSHLDSQRGREPFPAQLPPDHGMFYSAWKCSLRAGVVALQQANDPAEVREFRRECDAIAVAVSKSETPFLASYNNAAWPCDTVPAIHALSAYDRIFQEDRYRNVIAAWLNDVRERLDPETGLLPHTAKLPSGSEVGVARATSQVIILRLLPDIEAAFAKRQYEGFRKRFLTTFSGAPCVLEYPSGISGPGDVDSGPLICGRSLSATVMMIGVAQVYGDQSLADAIAQAGESVGMPWTSGGQKRYLGGILPIGDIMVAYAQVARPWFAKGRHHPDKKHRVGATWRWPIHAWSMLVFLPALLAFWRRPSAESVGRDRDSVVT